MRSAVQLSKALDLFISLVSFFIFSFFCVPYSFSVRAFLCAASGISIRIGHPYVVWSAISPPLVPWNDRDKRETERVEGNCR